MNGYIGSRRIQYKNRKCRKKNRVKQKLLKKREKKSRKENPWEDGYQANHTVVVYSDSALSLVVFRTARSSVCGGLFSYNSLIKQKRRKEQGNSRSTGLFDVHQEAIDN